MANGGTLTGLVSEGKGRWGIMVTVAMTLATGVGWYFSQEGRDYTDARIATAISQRASYTDYRYANLIERLGKVEAHLDRHDDELSKVWSEMARRIDRQGLVDSQQDDGRRLDALEREVNQLRRALYGRRGYEEP